jgi:molybdenum cofactor cytidylyltransferase
VNVTSVVLAAGAATRFGSPKLLAPLAGRPLLQHVLDALAEAAPGEVVVVLGDAAPEVEAGIAWRRERRVRNPRPQDGLSSSLRIGLDAAAEDPACEAVLVVLGDQPAVRPDVVGAVIAAAEDRPEPLVRARYARDGAPNPVLVRRSAWALAAGLSGDRGLGPLLAERPELVHAVDAHGSNPDVDTPADLAALRAAAAGAGPAAGHE